MWKGTFRWTTLLIWSFLDFLSPSLHWRLCNISSFPFLSRVSFVGKEVQVKWLHREKKTHSHGHFLFLSSLLWFLWVLDLLRVSVLKVGQMKGEQERERKRWQTREAETWTEGTRPGRMWHGHWRKMKKGSWLRGSSFSCPLLVLANLMRGESLLRLWQEKLPTNDWLVSRSPLPSYSLLCVDESCCLYFMEVGCNLRKTVCRDS